LGQDTLYILFFGYHPLAELKEAKKMPLPSLTQFEIIYLRKSFFNNTLDED